MIILHASSDVISLCRVANERFAIVIICLAFDYHIHNFAAVPQVVGSYHRFYDGIIDAGRSTAVCTGMCPIVFVVAIIIVGECRLIRRSWL